LVPSNKMPLLIGGGVLALIVIAVIAAFSMGVFTPKPQPAVDVNPQPAVTDTKIAEPVAQPVAPPVVPKKPVIKPVKTPQVQTPSKPRSTAKPVRKPTRTRVDSGPEIDHPTEIPRTPVDDVDRWMNFRTRENR
jgi:hypothetical protein